MRDTLRRRLTRTLVLPLLVLYAISGGFAYLVARHYAERVYDLWLYDSVISLAHQVRLSGGRAAIDLPRAAQQILETNDEDLTLFRVVGERTGNMAGGSDLPLSGANMERLRDATLFDASVRGHRMRWASVMLDVPEPGGEKVAVLVGETTNKRERLQDELLIAVLLPQVAVMLIAGIVTYRTLTAQTERIHALSRSLRDQSVAALRPLSDHDLPQELVPLTEALNAVLRELDNAAATQRSFIANAAHQLRTPLTTINLQAEQARHCTTVEEMRSAVAALQVAANRAARLANQLLLLSRAEPDARAAHNRVPTDLYALAFETAGEWAGKAIAAGFDFGFDESSAHVEADVERSLLGEAINNLIDNALKHCPAGTRVTVAVALAPDATIVVEDNGPGIPEVERARVVKRFHRGDAAKQGGSGLGLAIVNEIAIAHGGRFVITAGSGRGTRFEIHLPVRAPNVLRPAAPAPTMTTT